MKLIIDKNLCLGCGACVVIAPKTFEIGADGKAEVIEAFKDEELKIKETIDSCPVNAIKSTD